MGAENRSRKTTVEGHAGRSGKNIRGHHHWRGSDVCGFLKKLDLGYFLREEPKGCADQPDVRCERGPGRLRGPQPERLWPRGHEMKITGVPRGDPKSRF